MSEPLSVRRAVDADRAAVDTLHREHWGGNLVAAHGRLFDLDRLDALVAVTPDGQVAGVLAYEIAGDELEIVSIEAAAPGLGAGTALLTGVAALARERGLARVWLITTNDNLDALRFYQRRGLRITGVSAGAAARARRLKPSIPLIGEYGIPIRDEITLDLPL
jgi:ribosomal protein S18 acetylase RimI-like enzyme